MLSKCFSEDEAGDVCCSEDTNHESMRGDWESFPFEYTINTFTEIMRTTELQL